MRLRTIKRVRDLIATSQNRVTIAFIECQHVVSLSAVDVHTMGAHELRALSATHQYPCPHCPEETIEEVREQKTSTQLWKEAGQP